MDAVNSIEGLAALLASPPRRRMLEVLLDGQPRSATELAIISRVALNTASTHLSRLVEAGLVSFERSGRHRFYRISEPRVSDVIETLYEFLPSRKKPPARTLTKIEAARTCYDHLAGRLGSSLACIMISRGYLTPHEKGFLLSEEGQLFYFRLGGALGAALTRHYFAMEWLRPGSHPRLVQVTPQGARAFQKYLGLKTY